MIILSLFVPSSETSVRIQTKLKYPPFWGGGGGGKQCDQIWRNSTALTNAKRIFGKQFVCFWANLYCFNGQKKKTQTGHTGGKKMPQCAHRLRQSW